MTSEMGQGGRFRRNTVDLPFDRKPTYTRTRDSSLERARALRGPASLQSIAQHRLHQGRCLLQLLVREYVRHSEHKAASRAAVCN